MKNVKYKKLNKTVTAGMLLALGIVLPFLTMQLQGLGNKFLPMHLPVMLCGLVCGPFYGVAVGCILPVMRSAVFSMPVMYPEAVSMAFELGTYGLVLGAMYRGEKKEKLWYLYICLITAMLSGRIVWGIAKAVLMGFGKTPFTLGMFVAGGFTNAIPGIILQLVLIPVIVTILNKSNGK